MIETMDAKVVVPAVIVASNFRCDPRITNDVQSSGSKAKDLCVACPLYEGVHRITSIIGTPVEVIKVVIALNVKHEGTIAKTIYFDIVA